MRRARDWKCMMKNVWHICTFGRAHVLVSRGAISAGLRACVRTADRGCGLCCWLNWSTVRRLYIHTTPLLYTRSVLVHRSNGTLFTTTRRHPKKKWLWLHSVQLWFGGRPANIALSHISHSRIIINPNRRVYVRNKLVLHSMQFADITLVRISILRI